MIEKDTYNTDAKKAISEYDNSETNRINSLFDNIVVGEIPNQEASNYFRGLGALGSAQASQPQEQPLQEMLDPRAAIGTGRQRFVRGFAAGWGDLLYGSGDTYDFMKSFLTPGEPQPDSKIGNYLRNIGEQYQNDNVLALSKDFDDMSFSDLFKGEFYSSKFSRLLPYALSFVIPYGTGSVLATSAMGRYGVKVLSKFGKAGKFATPGTGLAGKFVYDAGKKGLQATKSLKKTSGIIGGGLTANLLEGAYLSGEAYNTMINEVDANGNPLFTPKEASQEAAGVMKSNLAWAGLDIIQYGLLFGGLGRTASFNIGAVMKNVRPQKLKFSTNIRTLSASLMKKILPNLPAAGLYASLEGLTEGFQEVYQEWAKYANTQEAKGLEYDDWTDWLKTAPTDQAPKEIKDIFWSSVGLGGVLGGVRGYFDSAAERTKAFNNKSDNVNRQLDDWEKSYIDNSKAKKMQDEILAEQVWNYYGDGTYAKNQIQQQVDSGKMAQESADILFEAIDNLETAYEKHTINSGLTEKGAQAAFFYEVELARIKNDIKNLEQSKNEQIDKNSKIITNKENFQEKKEQIEKEYNKIINEKRKKEAQKNEQIEFLYTRKKDTAPKTKAGARDKRFKPAGLSDKEFETLTQEGEQQKQEREAQEKKDQPSRLQRVTETAKKAGAAVVTGAQNVIQAGRDRIKSIQDRRAENRKIKDAVNQIDEMENITSSAKTKLKEAVENGEVTVEDALNIKGTGRDGNINNKDVNLLKKRQERKDTQTEEASPETPEDVKKKDQNRVVPKSRDYQEVESKGSRTLEKSKIEKGRGKSYYTIVKDGEKISYVDQEGRSDVFVVEDQDVDIELEVRNPQEGQENVVNIDGQLFFEFNNKLYESEIIVKANGVEIGKVAQRDFAKGFKRKAKKTSNKSVLDKVKQKIKKKQKDVKDYVSAIKDTQQDPDEYVGLKAYAQSGGRTSLYEYSYIKSIVDKKFPGFKGILMDNLIDDYGQKSVALAFGNIILINKDQVTQTTAVHEAGHIYYTLQKNTPLMKRIRKLLYRSKIYEDIRREYPELILINYKGDKITLGELYDRIKTDQSPNVDNAMVSLANELQEAEIANDNTKINELFNGLLLLAKGDGAKEVRRDLQDHVIEEAFVRTLENYSNGTADSVIEGTAARKQLEKDILEFYKKTKDIATDEEAREFLNIAVADIENLNLETAIKYVLTNFEANNGKVPKIRNSAYGARKRASKDKTRRISGHSVIYSHISKYIGKAQSTDQITASVLKDLQKNYNLSEEQVADIKTYIEATVEKSNNKIQYKQGNKRFEKLLDDVSQESETLNDIEAREEKDLAMSTTMSNVMSNIVDIYNGRNPDNPMSLKKLMAKLIGLAKDNKYDSYLFITAARQETDEIANMFSVLDQVYLNPRLSNAKLLEMKMFFDNVQIENFTKNALVIEDKGVRSWRQFDATSSTLENRVVTSLLNKIKKDQNKIGPKLAAVYNELFDKDANSTYNRRIAAKKYLDNLLEDVENAELIDKDAVLNNLLYFDGRRDYLHNILFDHTINKFGNPDLKTKGLMAFANKKFVFKTKAFTPGIFNKQIELRQILTQSLILSRASNYLSIVDNVENQGVSILNKENSLHNKSMRIANRVNNNEEFSKKNILHPDNNIFTAILEQRKKNGELVNDNKDIITNPLGISINSGLMTYLKTGVEAERYVDKSLAYTRMSSIELLASDYFQFISQYNKNKNKKSFFYQQPIAVFSDKSRRYYVDALAAHNDTTTKIILDKIKNNPAYKDTYTDGSRVFPFDITNNQISNIKQLEKDFNNYIEKNIELFKGNKDFVKNNPANKFFLTSYIANKFMAQQFFIHDHRQSKNEIDYIKRTAGAIASGTPYDRNAQVEMIIYKDTFDNEGNIQNDAMGYMLPEQIQEVSEKFGDIQKVGSVLKFVYYHTDIDTNETVYLKFAVHPITKTMEDNSEAFKKIADDLRARHTEISEVVIKDFDGENIFLHGNLVLAVSESSTKVFKKGVENSEYVYDIFENTETINQKQNELYLVDNYQALSGEGLRIQLELDKQSNERFYPSQLFYHLHTNIDRDGKPFIDSMTNSRTEVMNENNESRNRNIIEVGDNKNVYKERDELLSSVSSNIYGPLIENFFSYADPRYPYINGPYNAAALGRVAHKGTKMYTKGSIAYQSSDLGLNLESYKKVSDYYDDNGNYTGETTTTAQKIFKRKLDLLLETKPNTIVSEAWIPSYMKQQGVEIGDLFIGTRIPAHGKVSSSVFIIKEFHEKVANTPSSNITIPAKVSAAWGADLDGDSVHMNFKYTEEEARKTNWKRASNLFFDNYVQLVSNDNKTGETQAVIDIKDTVEKILGTKTPTTDSQLLPTGDALVFENNVPGKKLVGIIAALQRTYNIFSHNNEPTPVPITINGKRVTNFNDQNKDEWFGVAQLLNIALDNAKFQYTERLGLTYQSVFSFVTLKRLGFDLNDIVQIYNSDLVKEYMEFKKSRSRNYLSRNSDIEKLFDKESDISYNELVEFLRTKYKGIVLGKKYNAVAWNKITDRIKDGLSINTNQLNEQTQLDAVLLIYTLEQFNKDVVRPFGKAFTIHQNIEKNPVELKSVYEQIEKIRTESIVINEKKQGGLNIEYKLGNSANNNIVTHAQSIFEKVLNRASITDLRYTPYVQSIIATEIGQNYLNDEKRASNKTEIINQVITNNLINKLPQLQIYDRQTLIAELEDMKTRYIGNGFLNILEIVKNADEVEFITLSSKINDLISKTEIENIQSEFAKLSIEDKNKVFSMEAEFNKFGYTGYPKAISFAPFFDIQYMESINDDIDAMVESENKIEEDQILVKLDEAARLVSFKKDKYSLNDRVDNASKKSRDIPITRKKAKKAYGSRTSFNRDALSGETKKYTFNQWVADKGIDKKKISRDSMTFKLLKDRYATYEQDYDIVKEFEGSLKRKPLSRYSFADLEKTIRKFYKLDNAASQFVLYKMELQLGKLVFRKQAEFLRSKASQQNFKYNIPGEDGTPQSDISGFRLWLGSNNMTSDRPEIQELINTAEREYTSYVNRFREYRKAINGAYNKLYNSKVSDLTIIERVKKEFLLQQKYEFIFGNITKVDNGKIRLLTSKEYNRAKASLSKEERDYYEMYRNVTARLFRGQQRAGNDALFSYVHGASMRSLEAMDKNGMFGLYDMIIDSTDYNRVKVRGKDLDGKIKLKTFYEWKYDVYKNKSTFGGLRELNKLRAKAKRFKKQGINEDGSKILLSDIEIDALINNGQLLQKMLDKNIRGASDIDLEIIKEYERRRGAAIEFATMDINTALLEFARGSLFSNGDSEFGGMKQTSILTNAAIAYNKNLNNENAVKYLTEWWKQGFLGKQQQTSIFGETGDKVIDGFVSLTSLRLLGFNLSVGVGNLLAGKYQELRKRGGRQFLTGEDRYFRNRGKSLEILKRYRVIQHSFDDFVHLSEGKGLWGKIEKASFIFMDKTEHYIQGAAFLGFLTDQEFNTGEISELRVREINNRIATLHGEGYTALDASLLSMYSYGRSLLQFKKWWLTLFSDRFGSEQINRFGEVTIGSYTAATQYTRDIFQKYFRGEITMVDFFEEYKKLSPARQEEIKSFMRGIGITVAILSMIAILEDDDDPDTEVIKALKKLENDIYAATDIDRFIGYTIIPASIATGETAVDFIGEVALDKKDRLGRSKALRTLKTELIPGSSLVEGIENLID